MKPWQTKLVYALFAFGIITRLWVLGDKAFHHDESIHSYYSFEIASEGRFKGAANTDVTFGYNPVYHGPFLYHWGGLCMFLLGDSDFTARVPFALMGILLLFLVWESRKLVGVPMALGMLGAVALSPIVNYYSRFAREDVHIGTAFFGVVVFGALYLKEKKSLHLLLCALSLIIGYCTKESSYIYGFAVGAFALGWGLFRVIMRGKEEVRLWFREPYPLVILLAMYGLVSIFVFAFVAIDYKVDPTKNGLVTGVAHIASEAFKLEKLEVSGPELREQMAKQKRFYTDESRSAQKFTYIVFAFLLSGVVLAGLELLRLRFSRGIEEALPEPKQTKPEKKKPEPNAAPEPSPSDPRIFYLILGAGLAFFSLVLLLLSEGAVPDPKKLIEGKMQGGSYSGLFLWVIGVICWFAFESIRRDKFPVWTENTGPAPIRIAAPWALVMSCILVILSVYIFLFTQMFADPDGARKGAYDYIEYWFGHQLGEYRLYGPFWYYIARLLVYEYLFLIVATVGFIVATAAVVIKQFGLLPRLTANVEPWGPFSPYFVCLIWMALFNTLIYGYLHEKAPWLAFHQALPWAAIAGGFLGWALSVWRHVAFRALVLLTVGPLALLTLKAHLQVNHNWADNTAELVSQQQADRDIRDMVDLVGRLAGETGLYEKFIVASEDEVEWPFPWYFRRYENYRVKTADVNAMVQFGDDTTFNEMRAKLGDKFVYRKYLHRGAWIENSMDVGDLPGGPSFWANVRAYIGNQQFKGKPFRLLFWNYFFHRERWSEINPKWGYVYIRKDVLPTLEPIPAPEGTFDPPRRINPELSLRGPIGGETQFRMPRGLAIDPTGNVHVVDSLNGRVVVMDGEGNQVRTYGAPGTGPGQLQVNGTFGPSSVAVDAQGNAYVADTWNHRVVKFGPDGQFLAMWGREGYDTPQGVFFGPRGIAVGPDNNVYVVDTGPSEVEVFDSGGNPVRKISKKGMKLGEIDEPVGITFAPDGNLMVADTGNERIQTFRPDGTPLASMPVVGWNADKVGMEPHLALFPNGHILASMAKKNMIRVVVPGGKSVRNFALPSANAEPTGIAVDSQGRVWVSDRVTSTVFRLRLPE